MEPNNFNISSASFEKTINIVNATLDVLKVDVTNEFYFSLSNLLNEINREINRINNKDLDLTLLSLTLRNLFELYLITRYVHDDKKAFASWMGQIHKDSADVLDGFISLFSKNNLKTDELLEQRKFIDATLEGSDYNSKGHFNIKDIAEKYDFREDYSAIHKLCSKLVHPTSYKVNSYNALIADDNYFSILLFVAVFFCTKIEELCHEIQDKIQA